NAHAGELFDMGVRVDPAGQDELARRVDFARAPVEVRTDGSDRLARDRDIGLEGADGRADRAAADNEVIGGHARPFRVTLARSRAWATGNREASDGDRARRPAGTNLE